MTTILQDIRYALRTLAKSPGFAALAVITIALGVGANTAVFSMVNGVLLRRLPYGADERLVRITQPSATAEHAGFSVPEIRDYQQQVPELAGVSEYHSMPFQLYGRGEPQRVQTGVVSDNFFDLLGVRPLHGRVFRRGEEAVGAEPVVVLSYRYWMEQMGGDPAVVGTHFTMNDHVHTIIGVLPPLPTYPDANDMWMPAGACPFRSAPQMMAARAGRMLDAYAVLRQGTTLAQARAGLTNVSKRLHLAYPEAYPAERRLSIAATPLREELTRASRPLFLTLLATAVFVLLIAAANFANLTLSRQLRRGRELALRAALGADRGRIFRQLVTESLVVTLAGGALGILLAWSGLGLLRAFAARVTPRAGEIALDPVVLGFALAVSVAVGLAAALVPLAKRDGSSLSDTLREGALTATMSRREGRLRDALVMLQVAVAFVLLIGAGLMTRSLIKLQRVDGGYEIGNVLTARVDLNWSRYNNGQVIREFADGLVRRLDGQPGFQAVALSSDFPLNNGVPSVQPFRIRGVEVPPNATGPLADITIVSEDYFKVIGVPLLRGDVFDDQRRDTANTPAIISQRLAATHWAGRDPIGDQLSFNGQRWFTIVGVVGDVMQNGPAQNVVDQIYLPYFITSARDLRVLVRTAGDPQLAAPAIRNAVRELDDKQPVVSVQTLDQLRGVRLSEPRVTTTLMLAFSILALVITAGGLGGVVAYGVNQRISEIGIRVALGARAGSVLGLVLRQGLTIIAIGLALGVGVALASSRLIGGLLFNVGPTDTLTYVGVALALLAVAGVASYVPARRALRIDPVQALRSR